MEGEAVGSCPPPGISTSCPPHAGSWQGCTGGSELLWRWELSTTPKTPCVLEARVPAPPNSTYSECKKKKQLKKYCTTVATTMARGKTTAST